MIVGIDTIPRVVGAHWGPVDGGGEEPGWMVGEGEY
jgi:hypothetical protein